MLYPGETRQHEIVHIGIDFPDATTLEPNLLKKTAAQRRLGPAVSMVVITWQIILGDIDVFPHWPMLSFKAE
jgi:hypothetical protein